MLTPRLCHFLASFLLLVLGIAIAAVSPSGLAWTLGAALTRTAADRTSTAANSFETLRAPAGGSPSGMSTHGYAGSGAATASASTVASAAVALGLSLGLGLGLGLGRRRRGHNSGMLRRTGHRTAVFAAAKQEIPQTFEGVPIGPPPDLPSLLLKNRIVYLATPITNEVAELIIAQLLYLNYESAEKPVTLYINSTGSTVKNPTRYIGEEKVGLETDAFAIADCIAYIEPEVQTVAVGQAYGTAAMLLGLGSKGKRFALPNATIMLAEPIQPPARGPKQASDLKVLAQEVLSNRKTMAGMLSRATGKPQSQVEEDTNRCCYLSPSEAVSYGLIDQVLTADTLKSKVQGPIPPQDGASILSAV